MITKPLLSIRVLFPLSLLITPLPACDDGPDTGGTSIARSAAQQRQACVDWCEAEKTLGCSISPGARPSCDAICNEGGSASCTDAGAVLACWQASPQAFVCGSSRTLAAAPPCLDAVELYREANDQCFVPTDFPAEGGGPSGNGGSGGAPGSGG